MKLESNTKNLTVILMIMSSALFTFTQAEKGNYILINFLFQLYCRELEKLKKEIIPMSGIWKIQVPTISHMKLKMEPKLLFYTNMKTPMVLTTMDFTTNSMKPKLPISKCTWRQIRKTRSHVILGKLKFNKE